MRNDFLNRHGTVDCSMRRFLSICFAFVMPCSVAAFPQNAVLTGLPDNTAKNLGSYGVQCADSSFDPDNCRRVADYSRFTYDPDRHQIYFFGGGHSTTMRDDIDVFHFDNLQWKSAYASTRCSDMTSITTDGTWSSSGHPVARHTYDQLIYAPSVHGLFITSPVYGAGYCGTFGGCGEWCAGKMLAYNPDARTWTAKSSSTNPAHVVSSEYDPVSGRIISAGGPGLLTYDPVSDTKTTPLSSSPITDYACNLVYFPPNDKFYYFERGTPVKVFAVTLDRTNWPSSNIQEVTGVTGTAGTGETGWAYDTANHIIGGGVTSGEFYAFDPQSKNWATRTMQIQGSGTGPTCYFHCLEYDPVDNVFVFYGTDYNIWAYCYKRGTAAVAERKIAFDKPDISILSRSIRGTISISLAGLTGGTHWSLKAFTNQGCLIEDLTPRLRRGQSDWKRAGYSGICILRLSTGNMSLTKQVMLVR
jgi:hypothetical protein